MKLVTRSCYPFTKCGKLNERIRLQEIDSKNWLEPDQMLQAFKKLTPRGSEQITSDDLVNDILEPQLDEFVPREVKTLFEVVRGTMCYDYFFYPIHTLTNEQLFRKAETAVTLKCNSLSAPKSISTFVKKIDF